jgi:hypothetical protein
VLLPREEKGIRATFQIFFVATVGSSPAQSSIGQSITNFMERAMITNRGHHTRAALAPIIGAFTIACGAICAMPPASIVGAMLWIGYCGNFVISHVPMGSLLLALVLAGPCLALMMWAGLGARDKNSRVQPSSLR